MKIKFYPQYAKCDPFIIQGDFKKINGFYIGKNTRIVPPCQNYHDIINTGCYNGVRLNAERCEVLPE